MGKLRRYRDVWRWLGELKSLGFYEAMGGWPEAGRFLRLALEQAFLLAKEAQR